MSDITLRRRRSPVRTLVSALLWVIAAMLAAVGIIAIVAVAAGGDVAGAAKGVYPLLLALMAGSGARAVARGGQPAVAAGGHPAAPSIPRAGLAPVDATVQYRERCSQFSVVAAAVTTVVLGGSLAGMVWALGAGSGVFAVLIWPAFIAALYLAMILADLAKGIEISGGRFSVGARHAGRGISGPLDAVVSWEILSKEQQRERLPRLTPDRKRPVRPGDLRFFRGGPALRLVVDPRAVDARVSASTLSGYVVTPVPAAAWRGEVVIRTRRPAELAAALERALPAGRAAVPAGSGPVTG